MVSQTLIAPEYELFPNRVRWTVENCYLMAEEGKLVGRYEVLDGEVVSKMGQRPPHFRCISLLSEWVASVFGMGYIRVQGPIALPLPDGEYSEPEPDVAVTIKGGTLFEDHHPGPPDLLLVAEISDTSLLIDLVVKARLYARAGIIEYWIVDLNSRQVHIHREPVNGVYTSVNIHTESEVVSTLARPEVSVIVANLLPNVNHE